MNTMIHSIIYKWNKPLIYRINPLQVKYKVIGKLPQIALKFFLLKTLSIINYPSIILKITNL